MGINAQQTFVYWVIFNIQDFRVTCMPVIITEIINFYVHVFRTRLITMYDLLSSDSIIGSDKREL